MYFFFFSSRRRHTRCSRDWSSDVCSSDLLEFKELYGKVPGSFEFKADQKSLQPPSDSTDVVSVIKGVIEAEQGAIDHYTNIIRTCQDIDFVTADMVTKILADEEGHLREFEGFLKEYEKR